MKYTIISTDPHGETWVHHVECSEGGWRKALDEETDLRKDTTEHSIKVVLHGWHEKIPFVSA